MGMVVIVKKVIVVVFNQGKVVVIVNKDLIVMVGFELVVLVKKQGCDLFYEVSVVGGILILWILIDSYVMDNVQVVSGIINGMVNYMLSVMVIG